MHHAATGHVFLEAPEGGTHPSRHRQSPAICFGWREHNQLTRNLIHVAIAQVILPLYPQFSISTSGSSLRILNEEFTRRPEQWGHKNVVHTVVPSYHDRPGYVNAMASLIAREVAEYTPEQRMQGVQVTSVVVVRFFLFRRRLG